MASGAERPEHPAMSSRPPLREEHFIHSNFIHRVDIFKVIVAIGTMQGRSGSYPQNLNLEKENLTIDFSTNGNTCPDRSQTVAIVSCFSPFNIIT